MYLLTYTCYFMHTHHTLQRYTTECSAVYGVRLNDRDSDSDRVCVCVCVCCCRSDCNCNCNASARNRQKTRTLHGIKGNAKSSPMCTIAGTQIESHACFLVNSCRCARLRQLKTTHIVYAMSTVRHCGLCKARAQGPEAGAHWLAWQCTHATLRISVKSDATTINERSTKSMLPSISVSPAPLAAQLLASPPQPRHGTNDMLASASSTTHWASVARLA